jgi:hypothetical protein
MKIKAGVGHNRWSVNEKCSRIELAIQVEEEARLLAAIFRFFVFGGELVITEHDGKIFRYKRELPDPGD